MLMHAVIQAFQQTFFEESEAKRARKEQGRAQRKEDAKAKGLGCVLCMGGGHVSGGWCLAAPACGAYGIQTEYAQKWISR
jgi:hypothetical protein